MGVNAEGKISLSVELQNFKNIASDLKKGLSAQLKQVPLDIEFNNKDLEKKAAEAIRNINEILSKSRVKNLDLSSILPNFVNEINKEGISDEIRMQMIKGFESALTNLRDIGIKQDYSKLKGFSGEDLKAYIADLNDVMDILKTIQGLTERQKQGILTTVLPSLSDLSGRGKDAAKKEYTKGAKKLDAILQLSGDYNGVLQYGVNPTATLTALNELNKKAKSGKELNKNEKQDLLGYLLRGKYLGLEFGKAEDENLKDLDYDGLLEIAKKDLDKATADYIETKSTAYFAALDKIYNSSAQEITYSDLTKGVKNTTNQKMQSMYDAEAPENPPTRIRAGNVTKRAIKLSSKEKPELRKRTQNEDKKDTKRTKFHSEEELKDSELDNEEKSIEEIEKKLQEIENKLSQVRDKIAKSKDDQAQLEEQIINQEKIFEEKNTAYTTYNSKYEKYSSFAKNAKYESEALKGTIANLDGQLEEEKQNKEKIESKYNQLIKKREEIKKEIEEKEKQLEAVLPKIQEQETGFEKQLTDLNNKKKEAQKVVKDREAHNKEVMPIQDEWLEWYDEALQKEYKFEGAKAKSEAFDALKRLGNEYLQFRRNPELSTATDKEAESARFAVKHYKLWQAAKEAGVAESRLDREKFDTDDDFAYRQAVEYLQKQRENTEQRRENLKAELEKAKAEVSKIQEDIDEVKKQQEDLQKEKSKLLQQFRVRPANNEDENEAKIRREQSQLESSNSKIQKLETSKTEAENRLNKLEEYLQKNELTDERKKKYDNRLEELKKERDTQEKILKQKKDSLQATIDEQNQLVQLEQELQESQNALIQEQKEAKARQEELDRQEEERRKKAEEERKKQEEANRKQQGNKTETDSGTKTTTEEVQNSGAGNAATSATSIPPEKLQEILTLLGNIQKALGTLEDGSDIPSITQSVKDMADALKELSVVLGEIKQKDFNLNIGLPSNNPIGQQGEAKRKILKELAQQYDELNSYFVNKYGDDSSAFNALSKLEGGSNYVATMMSDYSVIGDTNASLSDKIEVYKTLIEQLRNFLIQEGGDLNKIVSNILSPDKIIEQINQDISNANPVTAISKIFEDIKVSIDASMAQINTESQGFNFLSGSAEEAAEAKRKFVEANKDVLQSIVASMPKIEQEAEALEKVEDIKKESKNNADINNNNNKENENTIKQQKKLLEQQQLQQQQLQRVEQEREKIGQKFTERKNNLTQKSIPLTKEEQENRVQLAERGRALQLDEQQKQEEQNRKRAEQNKKNIQFELEQARLLEQAQNEYAKVQAKQQQEQIKQYEKQFYAWGEEDQTKGQLSFLSVIDQNTHDLDTEYKELIKEEQEHAREVAEKEAKNAPPVEIPIKGQLSFTTDEDIEQIGKTIQRDLLDDKAIRQIEQQYARLIKSSGYIRDDLNIEKTIYPFTEKNINSDSINELIGIGEEIKTVKAELASMFNSEGKIVGDSLRVKELLEQYTNLTTKVKELKAEISSPTSKENIALKTAKDAEKAEKELDNLKNKVDNFFAVRKKDTVESTVQSAIRDYGATNENGELRPIESPFFNDNKDLIQQQQYVISLSKALDEYRIAVDNLKKTRESDNIKLDDLKEANKQVELLENKINELDKAIKKIGKGNTNATDNQINGLKTKIQNILDKNTSLSTDATDKLKGYLDILNSGASISKSAYDSMSADIKQFSAEQTKSLTIWDLMTMKMREGIAFLATKFSFYQIFNQFRQGIEVIHQFDDALTEMMKVSDETRKTLEDYQKTTFDTADAIGTSALQLQNSTADFMRLGESLNEAVESAKVANVLMNVSEFQSIDEATKSLIAMSAAYDDLSKMNIIDKLNEVGNNYSISTSGAAEALQMSASALKTAGNDMDEALALVTAGNQVVQDISKAGNGLRTIALRLTGTKSAKEELEELGEDTDSLITTQSKLRDTIKEATAVASNGFKGFDILNDNGNYKSTYEIMLGIAQIYQEIVDTDKQLGRNNANLLLETVAGKTRANVAASIFQSPDVLEAAYKSSQEANNSAMEENDKFLESISGHLAQLTNAWQEMWANAANRETINTFIDLGKILIQIVNTIGVLPSSLAAAYVYFNLIKKGAENGGIINGIKIWIKGLTQVEGKLGNVASGFVSIGSSIKGGFSAALPVIGGVATAIGVVGTLIYAFVQHQKQVRQELVDTARKTGEEWQTQRQSLSDYASQYEELKTKLDTGNLSEQETLEVKQQIYDIQKQITEQYGTNAGKIDLINGKLREQLNIISGISEAEANRIWNSAEYQKGFEIAKKAMTTESDYSLSQAFDINNIKTSEDKALSELVKQYTKSRKPGRDSGSLSPYRVISGTPIEAEEQINELIEQIEKLQEQNPDNEKFQKRAEEVISYLNTHIDTITKIREDNEASYFEGLPIELMATKGAQNYKTYTDYQSAVSNLESAYISGDTKKINEAREAFEEATIAKDKFLQVSDNNEYSILFDQIDTSVVDIKNKTEDASKAVKKALQMDKEISRFEDYKTQKKISDTYNDYLEGAHLDKIGNVDNTNRPFIFWDKKEAEKQKDALESWGESVEDVIGSYSTVFGGSGKFDNVEIAYTPIIDDGTGKGKLLTKETLNNYISTLIDNAGEGWTDEDLLKLDAQGLIIDGQKISNVIAQIRDIAGDTASGIGFTAQQVGETMHDWQSRSLGYIENYQNEWKEAIKQGKSFDEYMQSQEKDLKDVTKATGKYTKEDKQLYQALKRVIDLDIDRVDAEQAFDDSANGSQVYRYALEDLMNALGYTMDDASAMIDMLVDNEIIYGGVEDAALSATDAYNQFSQEVATAIENVSKLNTVLTESVSGAGISTQNIDAFKEMFGDDYVYALERSANGYHINAENLQTLTDKQKALMNADFQNTLDAQYDALKRCNDEIVSMSSKGQDTSGLLSQREGILQRIQDTQDLMMAYQASTSAYQTWINAQSNGNEYDMYDKIAAGYDTVKDLIDRGWSGDDTVRSYLDLIYGESFDAFTASGEECAEMFDKLDEKIEDTSFSIHDFFQFDESGKLTSNGIFNFFDALEEKQEKLGLGENEKWIKDDGTYDFGFGRDREAAEALGIDVELFQSMLRAAVSAGFELNLDQPMWAMNELKDKAVAAQEELDGFNNIDFSKFDEEFLKSDEAYDVLSGHVSDVYDYIQRIQNSDELAPDVKTDLIENAQDMLAYLVALEREAADKGDIDLKIEVAEKATDSIKQLVEDVGNLPKELSEYNWDSITDAQGLEKAKEYIEGLKDSGAIDTSTAESFLSILYEAIDQLNIIDNYEANPEFKGNTVEAFNDVKNAKDELEQYIATAQQLEEKHNIKFNFSEDEKVKQLLSIIYEEGTIDILGSLDIDSDKTPKEIIEMLESGERDVDVLLNPDSSELEEKIEKANQEKVVTHKVNSVANDVVNKTTNIVEEQTNKVINEQMDTSSYDEGAKHVEETNKKLANNDTNINVGMDKKEFDQGSKETENKISSLDKLGAFPSVTLTGISQVVSGSETIKSSIDSIKGKTVSVTANFFSNGLSALQDGIQSAINKARELMNTHIHLANGTAHFQGTAFSRGSIVSNSAYAGGKWGLPNDQTALTGELGTEIVVRDGNWFTVGDNGAEFVNLKKGDIVFNHKQSEELLENGYVTSNKGRGHLVGFANGTAYSSGTRSGATRARVSTSSSKSSSSRKSSGGSGRSSGGGSGRSGGGGGSNSSSKDAKETKNTLDEVEILISRIERSISNLDKTIGSTYTTWSKRNNAIASNLKNVSTEIKDQEKAFTTYVNKAKSVGLSSSWKAKIRTGAFRIEDVKDSDLWDKINEYKQWWEKALACKDAIVDLREKEGELYKQRFDNEQSYYEAAIADTQHALDMIEAYNDQLSEAGRLGSVTNIQQQITLERKRLAQLTNEYNSLIKQRDNAVKSGKIIKGSEAWNEMQQSINEVSESIAEANTNLITFANNIRDISFDRWEKIHDAIGGVVNELEFFYDMLDSDKMFDEQGTITNQGITGFALLAQEYDTYFKEVQRYQDEINETNRLLSKAKYDQNLVDKLKELKEAQQDAAANAKKTKESMIDLTEDGIKKQIDYVKKLIEDYEDLLETQKDQTDYAKKVADQQKEINKLEKQYRAIQNDDSEEGATKRQQLRDQINEKRQELQDTQEDRRLSETKDILGDFEEKFEEFLENKLKNIEGIVREVINATNENKNVIKDTINSVANSYGYTPSDTLKAAIDNMSNNLVSYFNGSFENPQVTSIAEGVDAIVKYFTSAQKDSEQDAKNRMMAEKVKQTGTHIQTYTDDNGNTRTGYFKDDGTLDAKYTGWATKNGSTYRFNNGELMKGSQWVTAGGKKYYLDSNGTRATNVWRSIGGKLYHFNQNGEMQTGLATINGNQFYFDKNGINQKGLQTINGKKYYFDTSSGAMAKNTWRRVNGNLYHFNQNGEAQTGLYSVNGKQFYFDKNGVSQKGLQTINGTKYYFDDNGVMIKDGWRQVGDGLYHFGKDGKAAKGWMKTDSGKWFFFDPKTSKRIVSQWIHNNAVTTKPTKGDYYVGADGVRVVNGKRKTNKGYMTFDANGKWKGYKTGTKGVSRDDLYWTNEGNKPEAIIRKSDGAILTPLSKGDSVIPNSAMKNMYQALTDPAKYLKQYTTPDIKVVQSNNSNSNNQPPVVNMQFIANGVQDANKFVNDLMNNKKLEKWIQEVTLGQANGNSNFKKYSYAIR